MRVVAEYPFNCTKEWFKDTYSRLLREIYQAVDLVDAEAAKTKVSQEKTRPGKVQYSPIGLNDQFKTLLYPLGWNPVKVQCDYSQEYYVSGYQAPVIKDAYREMDFIKEDLGVEVQFGKYSFMVYNVCAKMTIFHNLGHINAGVEIVPVKHLSKDMSTGVSYFEQFEWDLRNRGVSDIDIPVLILGIDI